MGLLDLEYIQSKQVESKEWSKEKMNRRRMNKNEEDEQMNEWHGMGWAVREREKIV